jgi:hypothetical protein
MASTSPTAPIALPWSCTVHGPEEGNGGEAARGLENKVPIVAGVLIVNAGRPVHLKLSSVRSFLFAAIADWAQVVKARGCEMISEVMAWS